MFNHHLISKKNKVYTSPFWGRPIAHGPVGIQRGQVSSPKGAGIWSQRDCIHDPKGTIFNTTDAQPLMGKWGVVNLVDIHKQFYKLKTFKCFQYIISLFHKQGTSRQSKLIVLALLNSQPKVKQTARSFLVKGTRIVPIGTGLACLPYLQRKRWQVWH